MIGDEIDGASARGGRRDYLFLDALASIYYITFIINTKLLY